MPILDTLIIRLDWSLRFRVDEFTHNFLDHHGIKISTFAGMFLWTSTICDTEFLDEEFIIFLILHENFILRRLQTKPYKKYGRPTITMIRRTISAIKTLVLPYHKKFSPQMSTLFHVVFIRMYIGQMSKSIKERIQQHKYSVRTVSFQNTVLKHTNYYHYHGKDWNCLPMCHLQKRLIVWILFYQSYHKCKQRNVKY